MASTALHWEGCVNARDLGGLRTPDGQVRYGAMVRSDSLSHLTTAGCQAVLSYGIHTVIDLRFSEEAGREPHPFRAPGTAADQVSYVNIPVTWGRDPATDPLWSAAFDQAATFEQAQRFELDANTTGYAHIWPPSRRPGKVG